MKTYSVKLRDIVPQWHVVDAADQSLGRLAARVAYLLRGKHRRDFTPNLDMRDFVVIVNAGKVRFTGNNKMRDKTYYHHTLYHGGLRKTTLEKMVAVHPERVLEHAVRGMLPHNRLGAQLYRHLKVHVGPEHPHEAQVNAPSRPVAVPNPKAKAKAKAKPVAKPSAVAPPKPEAEAVAKAKPVAAAVPKPKAAAKTKAKPVAAAAPKPKARAKTKARPVAKPPDKT